MKRNKYIIDQVSTTAMEYLSYETPNQDLTLKVT